jgi:hypothetical protein
VVVATGDFNGDGILDLAVGSDCDPSSYPRCLYGDISILLGNGDGTFRQAVVEDNPTAPRAFAVGDFNGDGISDLAVAHTCSDERECADPRPGVKILLGDPSGKLRRWGDILSASNPTGLTVADFDHDGLSDLAIVYQNSSIETIVTNKSFQFFQVPGGPVAVVASDLNGDGKLDLAVASECGKYTCHHGAIPVLLGNGDGTFQEPVYRGVQTNPHWLGVGEMNADDTPDLFVGGDSFLSVLLGNGDSTFRQRRYTQVGEVGVVGDVNNDGISDVVTGFAVLLGKGKAGFGNLIYLNANASGEGVALGDFNRDGFLDIAVTNFGDKGDDSVVVLLGNGDGTFR